MWFKLTFVQRFNACYKKIFEIDETLRQLGLTVNYDRIYFMTIGVLITWFTVNFSTCIVVFIIMREHTNVYKTIGAMVAYSYALAVNAIIIFEFYIFVKYVNLLSKQLKTLFYSNIYSLSQLIYEKLISQLFNVVYLQYL